MRSCCFTTPALALLALLATLSGCRNDAVPQPGPAAELPPRVPIIAVERIALAHTTTQPATVAPYARAEILSRAAGYVAALHFDIGDSVEEGDVLLVISQPSIERQVATEEARVRQFEAEEKRWEAEQTVAAARRESQVGLVAKSRAELEAARATLEARRTEWTRTAELVRQQAVARRLLDEATQQRDAAEALVQAASASLQSAEADSGLAEAQVGAAAARAAAAQAATEVALRERERLQQLLDFGTIRAPFDGVVTERWADLGDLVGNSDHSVSRAAAERPLLVVEQIDRVRVLVAVPERHAVMVNAGDTATVSLPAASTAPLPGVVTRTAAALNANTRTMNVEIELPNPHRKLLSGMFGQATIELDAPRERRRLPASAVRFDNGGAARVFLVGADGRIEARSVVTGLDDGELIEIVSGLQGDERVVGPTLHRCQPGEQVRAD